MSLMSRFRVGMASSGGMAKYPQLSMNSPLPPFQGKLSYKGPVSFVRNLNLMRSPQITHLGGGGAGAGEHQLDVTKWKLTSQNHQARPLCL